MANGSLGEVLKYSYVRLNEIIPSVGPGSEGGGKQFEFVCPELLVFCELLCVNNRCSVLVVDGAGLGEGNNNERSILNC